MRNYVDMCSRCLDPDPLERPTALVAALLLAEAVDARVYVPIMDLEPVVRPSVSAWDTRAANAPTSNAVRAGNDGGRHRAG